MYYGLKLRMFDAGVSIEAIADLLKSHRNTVSNKLNGRGNFDCAEMLKIKNAFFPDATMDELIAPKSAA